MNSLKLKLKPGHSIHGKGSQSEPEESNTEKKKKKTVAEKVRFTEF